MSRAVPPVRKSLGQNFLHDPAVIERIVRSIAPEPADNMVEIGPGHGALTIPLLTQLDQLNVVEYDRALAARLPDFPGGEKLNIHQGDAVQFDFSVLGDDLRVVGNLPYQISSPLLFRLVAVQSSLRDMVFMLQREVVDRITAAHATGNYGRLTVSLAAWFDSEKLFDVGPGAFKPPPKVHSSIVRLVPRAGGPMDVGNHSVFDELVRRAFGSRRKTLRNGLKGFADADQIAAAGIDPGARAETIAPERFAELSRQLG